MTTILPLRYRLALRDRDPTGRDGGTFGPVGVEIDKADMDAGKGFPALRFNCVRHQTPAIGEMAAISAAEGAANAATKS